MVLGRLGREHDVGLEIAIVRGRTVSVIQIKLVSSVFYSPEGDLRGLQSGIERGAFPSAIPQLH